MFIAMFYIHNSWKLEGTQMFINRRLDKQIVLQLHEGILLSNKKKWPADICKNVDKSKNHEAKWKKSHTHTHSVWTLWLLKWSSRTGKTKLCLNE